MVATTRLDLVQASSHPPRLKLVEEPLHRGAAGAAYFGSEAPSPQGKGHAKGLEGFGVSD